MPMRKYIGQHRLPEHVEEEEVERDEHAEQPVCKGQHEDVVLLDPSVMAVQEERMG